ncbi:MAG: DUF6088 family protein [Bdellovibrionaceae bacterium]|nr:DUF6088 family protein [Pseudobdellovibrionaceae bacterium]
MANTVEKKVTNRILKQGPGWVFTPGHFLDLGSPVNVRQVLFQLGRKKVISRIAQGIYCYPIEHKTLGAVPPSIDAVAQAIAEKNGAKIQASGAYAANRIGFSDQVPARAVFLTDGPPKKLKIGKLEIVFKQTTVKNMAAAGSKEAMVGQTLKYMGKEHLDDRVLQAAKAFLKGTTRREFEKNLKFAPQWIRSILFALMENEL